MRSVFVRIVRREGAHPLRPIVAKRRDCPLFVVFLRQFDCPPPAPRVWCWPSALEPSRGHPTVVPHDGRAGRARRSPSPRCRPPAPRIDEERGVIHKVLILFALCIAGLAAIAAGFQHIPS
ncbi:hypothetical protein [Burkholderia sp. BE17]|uniref:hypothetical protein n=1 Tax=Burkholderia sp. BE17 TaxID=2656644 RepID=UPI00128AFAD4|nr:hypothetical protein [Burkholderia sp. BE17]MPV69679.1 hypothetical protein [Burkholderia sp. BE17]